LWWCFYDRESGFERFLERAVAYVSGGEIDAANWPVRDRMECLRALLAERRFLLVLDGAERLLRAYARMDVPYLGDEVGDVGAQRATPLPQASPHECADLNVGLFLQWLAGLKATKTILTSRLLPRELEGLAGVARMDLTQMDPEDAVRFFRAMGIRGTRTEIQAACEPYGYLPLALRLLAGLVVEDPARPGDIAVATDYEITENLRGKEHHILEQAYNALDPAAQELLSRIAAFRSPVGYGVLRALFGPPSGEMSEGEEAFRFESERVLKDTLRRLIKRGLLLRQEDMGRYDLHPVVRKYAYDRLTDRDSTHKRLRDYFASLPQFSRSVSLDDLMPVIELFFHTVRAGEADEAYQLYYERISPELFYMFGAYRLRLGLIEELLGPGAVGQQKLKQATDQIWVLNNLAGDYGMLGRPLQALQILQMAETLAEQSKEHKYLGVTCSYLATRCLVLGMLSSACHYAEKTVELGKQLTNPIIEASGHQRSGLLAAHVGDYTVSRHELDLAASIFEDLRGTDWERLAELIRWERIQLEHSVYSVAIDKSIASLLQCDFEAASSYASRALDLATQMHVERDMIRCRLLCGKTLSLMGELEQSENSLREALHQCRRIELVEVEAELLLELARVQYRQAAATNALPGSHTRALVDDAIAIADRCQYRLQQADIHNFLAQWELNAVNIAEAREHAEIAKERAWCDGPPHRYEAAFQEAERLLREIEQAKT